MAYKSFLEITDMPTDKLQALGKLRTVLVATFNKAREHKHRMVLLKTVIKFMHTKIVEWEKGQVKVEEATAKALEDEVDAGIRKAILDEATKLEIDLDERLSTEKLAIEFETLKATLKTTKAEGTE